MTGTAPHPARPRGPVGSTRGVLIFCPVPLGWACPTGTARAVLTSPLAQDLGDVISNMNTLNRNLENLVAVGRDVERAGDVVS